MPTPTQAAVLRQLAARAAELKRITDIRNATMASAKVIEAAYAAELAAQAELATAAAELGVPLAEATATYGTGAAASGAASTGAAAAGTAIGWPAILAGIAILGAVAGGGYIYTQWGKPSVDPVMAGPAMTAPRSRPGLPVPLGGEQKPNDSGEYYIYAVNTSGWSFYIGPPSEVVGRKGKSITDGGTSDTPIEYKKLVDKRFRSASEAEEYLKARVSPGKQSYWTGTWMKFEGGEEYRTLHVGL